MTKRTQIALLACFALLGACNNDLDREPLVYDPRILAIVADPPEAAPGQDVHVRVLAVDPRPPGGAPRALHYTFRLCVDPASFFGGFTPDGTGGVGMRNVPCSAPMRTDTGATTVPGMMTQGLADQLPMYAALAGLQAADVERVLTTVGLPIQIRVAVSATDASTGTETTLISGTKLIGLTSRARRTTNPPYAYFSVGDSTFLGGFGDSFECALWFSDPPIVKASVVDPNGVDKYVNELTLQPLDDPFDWMETYPYFDYANELRTGREGAYYSWFTTSDVAPPCTHEHCHTIHEGGDTTQVSATAMASDPAALSQRGTTWDVPSTPGTYDLWLVVRDGHLGESACHTRIEVVAPTP